MKVTIILGSILLVFGATLASGLIQFQQLAFCVGPTVFGACLGVSVNYTWLAGVGLMLLAVVLLVVGSLRR